jgi:hypothetical protein
MYSEFSWVQPPLLQAFPFPTHWGRWHSTSFLRPACLFTVHMGSGSSPLSCEVFLPPPLLQALPLLVAGHMLPLLPSPAILFVRDFPSPHLLCSGFLALFATCLFCCYWLFSFSFFPGWGLVCPGGYADLAQGCLCEYHVPLSSPWGPCHPKPSGCWHLAAAWEPSWFLCLTWSGDALHRLEVWRSHSFASSRWFFL